MKHVALIAAITFLLTLAIAVPLAQLILVSTTPTAAMQPTIELADRAGTPPGETTLHRQLTIERIEPAPTLSPQPGDNGPVLNAAATLDSVDTSSWDNESSQTGTPDPNTRLACGFGIISRLRNRGDRCIPASPYPQPVAQPYVPPYSNPVYPNYVYPPPTVAPSCPPVYICPPVQVPVQPCLPAPPPIATQPIQPAPIQPSGQLRAGCNCQDCCREFTLTRYRTKCIEKEVPEEYIETEIDTSTFCDSKCDERGDCVEMIGIQNRKRHVVKTRNRLILVTELEPYTVIEKHCLKCGCFGENTDPRSGYDGNSLGQIPPQSAATPIVSGGSKAYPRAHPPAPPQPRVVDDELVTARANQPPSRLSVTKTAVSPPLTLQPIRASQQLSWRRPHPATDDKE